MIQSFCKDPFFLKHWENTWLYGRHKANGRLSKNISLRYRKYTYPHDWHAFMFIDDIHLRAMPIMLNDKEREKYSTRLEPFSREKEILVAHAISARDRHLGDALSEFIRSTVQTICSMGSVFYEIVYQKDDTGKIKSFELEFLEPSYLFKFGKNYYQFIHWWEAKESWIKVQIIKIPNEKILRIDFPKNFGGKNKIKNLMQRFKKLDKDIVVPYFQIQAMEKNQNIWFEYDEFIKNKYLEIAILTKLTGWNQREYSTNHITEYYSMIRLLRQRKLEATLRQEIISKLNETLNWPILNLETKIIIDNLFTVQDVEEQEKLLEKWDIAFADIIKALDI